MAKVGKGREGRRGEANISREQTSDLRQLVDSLKVLEVTVIPLSPALHELHPFPKFELDISLNVSNLLHDTEHISVNTTTQQQQAGQSHEGGGKRS
jgi:hypothetical protein